jgi:hypothetical protein
MLKRGQIAFYLVIVVVMLSAFGYGFYYLLQSNDSAQGAVISEKMSLDAQTNLVKTNIQDCLEKRAIEGLDYYGLNDNSEELIPLYIDSTLNSCVDYSYFKSHGLNIEYGNPESYVEITEDAILISTNYSVTIRKEDASSSLETFGYSLKRQNEAGLSVEGIATNEIRLLTEDHGAEFAIPAGTRAVDAAGNPLTRITVKVQDKNFDGLANSVVIGSQTYRGLPDGARFDPAIEISFAVNYADVPRYVNPKDLKCGFYDPAADIWRTYLTPAVVDNPDDKTYTVKCLVDHFSTIAVLQCGSPENTYEIVLDHFFENPIQVMDESTNPTISTDITGDPTIWFKNAEIKGGESTDYGLHLIPEKMIQAGCKGEFENPAQQGTSDTVTQTYNEGGTVKDISKIDILLSKTDYYSGGPAGFPLIKADRLTLPRDGASQLGSLYCDRYLLQDWDNDDNPKFVPEVKPLYQLGYLNGAIVMKAEYNQKFIGSANSPDKMISASDMETFKKNCVASCSARAKSALNVYYDNVASNMEGILTPGSIDPSLAMASTPVRISGDGINDNVKEIYCQMDLQLRGDTSADQLGLAMWDYITYIFSGGIQYYPDPDSLNNPTCIIDSSAASTDHPFNNLLIRNTKNDANNGLGTMEYPQQSDEQPFYATPMTYGYAKTNQFGGATSLEVADYSAGEMAKLADIGLGGFGEYDFEMRISGGSCVQGDDTPDRVELSVSSLDGSRNASLSRDQNSIPASFGVIDSTCSDSCIWTLNDPLTQQAGQGNGQNPPGGSPGQAGSGRIVGGPNSVRSYVSNGADKPDGVFYTGGRLIFTGIGLILEDRCGTTLSQRMGYLFEHNGVDTGGVTPKGREGNCLYLYTQFKGNDISWKIENTRLCGEEDETVVDFSDPAFQAYYNDKGAGYCGCMAYSSEIFEPQLPADSPEPEKDRAVLLCIHHNCQPGDLACERNCKTSCGDYYKNFDVLSPNGGAKTSGSLFTCPDILDYARDVGCACGQGGPRLGDTSSGSSAATKYCCAGAFIDKLPTEGLAICRNGNTVKKWCASDVGKLDCTNCLDSSSPPTIVGTTVWVPVYNNECP